MTANVLSAWTNLIDDATFADGSWSANLPLTNLASSNYRKVARSSTCKRSSTRLRAVLAAEHSARCVAFAKHNFSSTAALRVRFGRASLDLLFDSEHGDIHDSRLTKSGGTNGTRVNERGIIVRATNENGVLRSSELDNAAWTKTNLTVTANATTGPDNASSAEKLIPTSTSGEHSAEQAVTTVAGRGYTYSHHVAPFQGYEWVILEADGIGMVWFNVETGEFGTTSGTVTSYHARRDALGFWRPQLTFLATGASTTLKLHVVNANGVSSFAGDTTSGVYAFGAMVQEGGDATDYIATTSATVTTTTSGRINHSPTNLASGVATQTLSNVAAGDYALVVGGGADVKVVASGTVLFDGNSVTCHAGRSTTVNVTTTGTVTLTVTGTPTAIHYRECLGLLTEIAATNASTYSSEFDNAAWTKGQTTISANAAVAPDGTKTADFAAETIDNNEHNVYKASVAAQTSHSKTFFIKANGRPAATVRFFNGSGEYLGVTFSLTTGAVTQTANAGGIFTLIEARSKAYDNGWYECTVRATRSSGTTFYVVDSNTTTTPSLNASGAESFVGDTSKGLYLWGSQLEGLTKTSYIPTTSASVTRTRDEVSVTGASFTNFYNVSEGTLYVEGSSRASGAEIFAAIDSGSANANEVALYSNSTAASFFAGSGGVTQANFTFGTAVAAGVTTRMAGVYKANDFAAVKDGGTVATDTAGTVPIAADRLYIGYDSVGAGQALTGHIRRVTYYPERLTNAELVTLTTSGPDALGANTGWFDALRMTFSGDTPTAWGDSYHAMADFGEYVDGTYSVVEINDTANEDGYVDIGRIMLAGNAIQPEYNADQSGYSEGIEDLSSVVTSAYGRRMATERPKVRETAFTLPFNSQAEADEIHEMKMECGVTREVLFIPKPDDMGYSQRYGGIGHLRELSALEYSTPTRRSVGFKWMERK
jgi:hypothetical protein